MLARASMVVDKMRSTFISRKSTPAPVGEAATVGILSFEVANAMSRAANLYRSLADDDARSGVLTTTEAARILFTADEQCLAALALAEKIDDLNRVAAVASRLGRRSSNAALLGFEHVYADLLAGRYLAPVSALGPFLPATGREADAMFRKLDRLAASTAALYTELEALSELEQSVKKLSAAAAASDDMKRVMEQRVRWRLGDVRRLRDASLWNQSYDKIVLLLCRAVCVIYCRIRMLFGDPAVVLECLSPEQLRARTPDRSQQLSPQFLNSGPMKSGEIRPARNPGLRSHCGSSPGRFFMECWSMNSTVLWNGVDDDDDDSSSFSGISKSGGGLVPYSGVGFSGQQSVWKSGKIGGGRWRFGPKSTLTSLAPASTVGGSALALHYANIILIIEKLLRYPHLVGEDARDDLYGMLPASMRAALRRSLRSYVKSMAIYDAFLAHDWKETAERTLAWLAPMASNMIRWQAERNIEQPPSPQQQQQQRIVLDGGDRGVLLLETLYFADRKKTEAMICELLLGLNYICRYEQQQNALLDCSGGGSLDFAADCLEWHHLQ